MKFLNQLQLGKRFRKTREEIGYTQDFVAKDLGISRQAIVGIESGKRKTSSFELFKLADLYGVNVRDLLLEAKKQFQPTLQSYFPVMRKQGKLSENDKKTLITFIKICEDYDSLLTIEKEKNA